MLFPSVLPRRFLSPPSLGARYPASSSAQEWAMHGAAVGGCLGGVLRGPWGVWHRCPVSTPHSRGVLTGLHSAFQDRLQGASPHVLVILGVCALVLNSVAQKSCPTLCDPVNRSTPGLPVHHQLPEFTQTLVHQVSDVIQPSHPLSSPSPPALNPSQHQSLFQ